jgi:hypothetical protein
LRSTDTRDRHIHTHDRFGELEANAVVVGGAVLSPASASLIHGIPYLSGDHLEGVGDRHEPDDPVPVAHEGSLLSGPAELVDQLSHWQVGTVREGLLEQVPWLETGSDAFLQKTFHREELEKAFEG